eukprot:TRINITY_DN26685_c0_g1_i1.p3 TRINITY_DN26685_c0_g1~~TRINITY_DN26685_c0_g1_i1.p3  ORF type:complete len:175 (-),score=15.88 TRINITY_DN26685_c0_g1_i1:133-657(-)
MSGNSSQQYGRVVCRGCHVTLMFPQGASNVRCSQCGTITQATSPMAELTCANCNIRLMYPRSAESVQCAMCRYVNSSRGVGHIQCSGCQQTLRYQLGASSVRCAACNSITNASGQQANQSSMPNSNDLSGADSAGSTAFGAQFDSMVVVQNPPAVDEDGNEINSIVVGMKTDTD